MAGDKVMPGAGHSGSHHVKKLEFHPRSIVGHRTVLCRGRRLSGLYFRKIALVALKKIG